MTIVAGDGGPAELVRARILGNARRKLRFSLFDDEYRQMLIDGLESDEITVVDQLMGMYRRNIFIPHNNEIEGSSHPENAMPETKQLPLILEDGEFVEKVKNDIDTVVEMDDIDDDIPEEELIDRRTASS